jgi:hypothetical protein
VVALQIVKARLGKARTLAELVAVTANRQGRARLGEAWFGKAWRGKVFINLTGDSET